MTRYRAFITCGGILLLIASALIPARALDVTVPGAGVGVSVGTSGNGASATVGAGGANAGATVGGSGAGVNATVGGSGASIDVTVGGDEAADDVANALDETPGVVLDTDAEILAAFGKLSPEDKELLTQRCGRVLGNPGSFDDDLVALCDAITRLDP